MGVSSTAAGSSLSSALVERAHAAEGRETWRLAAWATLVGVMIAGAYAGRFLSEESVEEPLYDYGVAVTGVIIYALLLGILLLIGRGLPAREFFALRPPVSWPGALGLALAGYVTIFVGAGLILIALDAGDEQGLTPDEWDPDKLGPYLANFVAIALVAPFVEELMYRGAGMTLLARFGAPVAVAATGILFGLAHGLVLALPALVLFGLVTAWLRLRTSSVVPPMLVHAAFNATSLIVSVAA
jgi:membrane protease YdiL (CAAX protease family)